MRKAAARLLRRTFRRVIRHRITLNRPKRSMGKGGALYHQTRGHPTSLIIRNNKKGPRPLKASIHISRLVSSRAQDKRSTRIRVLQGRALLRDRSTTRASQSKRSSSLRSDLAPLAHLLCAPLSTHSLHRPSCCAGALFIPSPSLLPADSCSEILHSIVHLACIFNTILHCCVASCSLLVRDSVDLMHTSVARRKPGCELSPWFPAVDTGRPQADRLVFGVRPAKRLRTETGSAPNASSSEPHTNTCLLEEAPGGRCAGNMYVGGACRHAVPLGRSASRRAPQQRPGAHGACKPPRTQQKTTQNVQAGTSDVAINSPSTPLAALGTRAFRKHGPGARVGLRCGSACFAAATARACRPSLCPSIRTSASSMPARA
jgi:hypothetical protein